MTNDKPIKCASKDFKKEPFYLIQSNGADKRFVVSFVSKEKIKAFLLWFIKKAQKDLQIKIREFEDAEHWVEFTGVSDTQKFTEALNKYEQVIFHDGDHALMIRLPETGEYVAFDEHGLVFIYSAEDYSPTLKALQVQYADKEKLINEYNHWHYRPPNAQQDLASLVNELGLK